MPKNNKLMIVSSRIDLESTVEDAQIALAKTESMLTLIRREVERAPWHDADPDAVPGAVSRSTILDNLVEEAEEAAREARRVLRRIAESLARRA